MSESGSGLEMGEQCSANNAKRTMLSERIEIASKGK